MEPSTYTLRRIGMRRIKRIAVSVFASAFASLSLSHTPALAQVTGPFAPVAAAVDASSLNNVAIIVGDSSGEVFRYSKSYDYAEIVPLASASKLLAGILAYRMSELGVISLNDQPQDYYNFWSSSPSDERSLVTLEQALSFTTGFNAGPTNPGCTKSFLFTVKSCVRRIHNQGNDVTPGTMLSYGPEHLQIAAGMLLEAEGGGDFNDLFETYVTAGLPISTIEWDAPSYNPWVSGGAEGSANDYAVLLNALFNGQIIQNLDDFFAPRTLNLARGYIPTAASQSGGVWEYAFGSWVECEPGEGGPNFSNQCANDKINSSTGAWGFTPWVDRNNGYWAIIATYTLLSGAEKAVELEQEVQPLIVNALQ